GTALASKPARSKTVAPAPTDDLTLALLETKISPPKRPIGSVLGVNARELEAFRETKIALPLRGPEASPLVAVARKEEPPHPAEPGSDESNPPRESAVALEGKSAQPPFEEGIVLVPAAETLSKAAELAREKEMTPALAAADPQILEAATTA